MPRPSEWANEESKITKGKLPVLPPLVTGRSSTPDKKRPENERAFISIGWSPVTTTSDSQKNFSSPTFPGLGNLSPQSNSSGRSGKRRPPPPGTYSSVDVLTPSTPSRYKSPFVGEEVLSALKSPTIYTPKKTAFKSPFVGDSSVLVPTVHGSDESQWISSGENNSLEATYEDNYEANIDMLNSLKALPPLPSQEKHTKQRLGFTNHNPERNSTWYDELSHDQSEILDKPFRLFADQSRNASDARAISDSISSYYSNSNYAFNDEFKQERSFDSVAGNRPLQQIPSITVPMQPFTIDQLDENKLFQCYSVFLLSDIYEWLLKVYFEWFNEYVFRKIEFYQMVQLLLEFQLPASCNQDVVDSNVDKIIESLILQGAVRFETDSEESLTDEITFIVAGLAVQGVFTNLLPCYSYDAKRLSDKQHEHCYCSRCPSKYMKPSRPILKLSEIINKSVGLWSDYWNLSSEELSELNPREVNRQSFIFDLIILEQRSLNLAHAAVEIYGKRYDPVMLPHDPNFKKLAFNIFEPMIELHKEFLLTPIFWKLNSQGKFIDGVGKIYLQWCNASWDLYLQYAESMATVHDVIKWEKEHNSPFSQWLKKVDESPEISRSKLYHDVVFFGGFFKALQNIPVTLNSILKSTDQSMEDYEYLLLAIKEIEKLNAAVDRAHGAAIDQRKAIRLSRQLVLSTARNSSTIGYVNINDGASSGSVDQERLDLRLNEKSRKIIKTGAVFKKRELWLENAQVYLILLDNYLLMTEIINKTSDTRYRLCERPIPIDYLSLEAREDSTLSKYSSTKSALSEQSHNNEETPSKSVRPPIHSSKSFSPHRPKSAYLPSPISQGRVDFFDHQDAPASFKVRNTATNESFTFSASTVEEKDAWVAALVSSFKSHHDNQSSRIYDLTCLSDMFSYEDGQAPINLPVLHEGSAISEALQKFYGKNLPPQPCLQADVRCTAQVQFEGETFLLCAVNFGIYMTAIRRPGPWKMVILLPKITRMEVNTRLDLLFVLADRRLCYFNIPSVICAYFSAKEYLPQNQITGVLLQEKVGFFKSADDFGNLKQLFYERKGKIVVLTPEFDRLTKRLKFFKVYKIYRLPGATNGLISSDIRDIIIFAKSFIVCSSRGALLFNESFNDEGLILPSFHNDKTMSGHEHHFPHHPFKSSKETLSKTDSSKQKMAEYVKIDIVNRKTAALGCFQLSDDDFIIIYDEAVVRINKNGEIPNWTSDVLVLDFYCNAASFADEFLILFGENLIQVYDLNYSGTILNDKLSKLTPVQIIKGKKIKLLNSIFTENPVLVLSHPSIPGRQLILEFQRNV
ncbi:LAME_0E08306g1_1 [Lachancea meyersii CBS 8951]|uniref:LAME_0E08306g1_1 n=1 Tax=Lachancea meyersii CBS 8951 TaxID=1266667 RepID=A0A1G4JIZ7_9SACH|nr:LAME_0E08306g1_1 [Lachancea meyersii CBS 8951]